MEIIVTLVGLLIVGAGVGLMLAPKRFIDWIASLESVLRFRFAILARLVLGILFLVAAPTARMPIVVQVVGIIALIAAVGIPILGRSRLDSIIGWWADRPTSTIRAWSVPTLAFGILLISAGA